MAPKHGNKTQQNTVRKNTGISAENFRKAYLVSVCIFELIERLKYSCFAFGTGSAE
jgi:hypothetical protein